MRSTIRRLAALVFTLLFSAGAAELGLRLVGYPGEHTRRDTIFDPDLGRIPADGWLRDFDIEPEETEIEIHGRSFPVMAPESRTRVLFLGDSATEGIFVPRGRAYPFMFEELMARGFPNQPVESINAGASGLSTVAELEFYRERLFRLDPDAVVLGLSMARDVSLNLDSFEESEEQRERRIAMHWMNRNSALAHFTYLWAHELNARYRLLRAEDMERSPWIPKELLLIDRYGFHMFDPVEGEIATYMKKPSPLIDQAFEILGQTLSEFTRLAREHGFRFTVLLIPTPTAVAGELRILQAPEILETLSAKDIHITAEAIDPAGPTERVLAICRELGIVCVDPTRAMRAVGPSVFFPNDDHPSAVGHEVLARALVKREGEILP